MSYKTDAIVLDAQEYKEYDRIYTILSRDKGKFRVLGVGTRKPKAKLASGMEPLTKNELFLVNCRGLDRIKGVLIDQQYTKLKADYDKTILVRRTARILSWFLPEEEKCEEIFLLFSNFLKLVEETSFGNKGRGKEEITLTQLELFWRGIVWLGIAPSLYHCVACRKKIKRHDSFLFSVPNGLRCKSCLVGREKNMMYISTDAVKILRVFLSDGNKILQKVRLSQRVLTELISVTRYTLAHITERRIIF